MLNFNWIICYYIFCLLSTLVSIETTKLYVCDNIWNVRRNHSLQQNLNMRNDTESIFICLSLRKFDSYSKYTKQKKWFDNFIKIGFMCACLYLYEQKRELRECERKKFGTEKGCGFVQLVIQFNPIFFFCDNIFKSVQFKAIYICKFAKNENKNWPETFRFL